MCGFCNIGKEVDPPSPIDENDFNQVTNGVWIGEFTTDNLPVPLYRKTAAYLSQGIDLGVAEFEKVDEDDSLLKKLFFAEADSNSSTVPINKKYFSTGAIPFVLTTTALIGASALLIGKIK